MASWIFHWTLALTICAVSVSAQLQCIGENGAAVDWYVLYKLPTSKKSSSRTVQAGVGYMYISSDDPKSEWKLSSWSVNETSSIPGRTLAPIYHGESSDLMYGLYNDQPPLASAASTFGHTKGAVVSDGKTGFWLIHSVPGFPMNPFNPETKEPIAYSYPSTATRYGQSFLCISLSTKQLNTVGYQLMFNKPKFYSKNIPEDFSMFPNLTSALAGRYVKQEPWTSAVKILSLNGTAFTSFAKSSNFGQELYSDFVAPQLKSDLQVESWSNGPGEFPSDCKSEYHVMDIQELEVKNKDDTDVQFKNSNDHSKWAITEKKKAVVCVGDINRMQAQLKRGGGTVCLKNTSLWNRYANLIRALDPCPLPQRETTTITVDQV